MKLLQPELLLGDGQKREVSFISWRPHSSSAPLPLSAPPASPRLCVAVAGSRLDRTGRYRLGLSREQGSATDPGTVHGKYLIVIFRLFGVTFFEATVQSLYDRGYTVLS